VLKGATIYAAAALGLDGVTGSVEPGKKADFVEIEVAGETPWTGDPDAGGRDPVNQWMYHFLPNCAVRVWAGGECAADSRRNHNL